MIIAQLPAIRAGEGRGAATANAQHRSRVLRAAARTAMAGFSLLAMAGCAIPGDEGAPVVSDGDTEEASLAAQATPPDVPEDPSTQAVKIVCPPGGSGCDYTDLQAAINAAQPGWTLLVKNGTYYTPTSTNPIGRAGIRVENKDGTASEPISLVAFPGHHPVIETLADTVTVTNGVATYRANETCLVLLSDHWIVDGFELRRCTGGITVGGRHVTIRNSVIHDNAYQGILVSVRRDPANTTQWVGASDLLIEQNQIFLNGTTYEATGDFPRQHCLFNETKTVNGQPVTHFKPSPGHCHGIYLSSNEANADQARITIRRNTIERHGGAGIHVYDSRAGSVYSDILVENNLFLNNHMGAMMARYEQGTNSHFRNNVVAVDAPVQLDAYQYAYNGSNVNIYLIAPLKGAVAGGMQVYNNIFYAPQSWYQVFSGLGMTPVYTVLADATATPALFDDNYWAVRPGATAMNSPNLGHAFYWNGVYGSSFSGQFRSVSSQEATGLLPGDASFLADPFLRPDRGRYEHVALSPALGRGANTAARPCPSVDFTGRARGSGPCDLGAFED